MIYGYYRLNIDRNGGFRWMLSECDVYTRHDGKRHTFVATFSADPLINYKVKFKADIV
jgi:hypothetical protein